VPNFKETIEIDADADATWRVLGNLESVKAWIPGIAEVELTDNVRVCRFDDGRVQHETRRASATAAARSQSKRVTAAHSSPGTPASSHSILTRRKNEPASGRAWHR
jgi:carbon monoxide dehydrogenase subunit G